MKLAINITRLAVQVVIFVEAIYQFHHAAVSVGLMGMVWIIGDLGTIARKYQ